MKDRTNAQTNERTNERNKERMNEWSNERSNERTNEQRTNKRTNGRTDGRTDGRMNACMHEWINRWLQISSLFDLLVLVGCQSCGWHWRPARTLDRHLCTHMLRAFRVSGDDNTDPFWPCVATKYHSCTAVTWKSILHCPVLCVLVI